mmetsp:Transcript_6203/g.19006  ORF Transcript_6203/g.19006 Transcript_6203/m.19006 type:complete len:124 (-) Transcript_6203:79-450(-)|eukprot:scaffold133041_cov31-Tisochrysis_lutea.AAC.7
MWLCGSARAPTSILRVQPTSCEEKEAEDYAASFESLIDRRCATSKCIEALSGAIRDAVEKHATSADVLRHLRWPFPQVAVQEHASSSLGCNCLVADELSGHVAFARDSLAKELLARVVIIQAS